MLLSKNLVPLRAAAVARVDAAAGEARSRIVTTAPGMADVYRQKLAEAEAVVAGAAAGPYIAAEAEVNGLSVGEQAARIIAAAERCQNELVAIETARMTLKKRVADARTPAEIEQAETDAQDLLLSRA